MKAKAEAQWKIQLGKWEKDKADGKGEVPRPVFHAPTSPDGGFHTPGNLFNAMISPMLGFGIRGVLWYQGESNADTMAAAKVYSTLFPKMIQNWRAHWGQGDFLFLFVQLASFKAHPQGAVEDAPWPVLREAQAGALALTNTGMDTAVDMGDANNIHPAHKSSVGKRLTLASRHVVYVENLAWSGPVFQSMEIRADKVRIHFKAQPGNGLVIGVPPWIPGGGAPEKPTTLKGFAVTGADRKFVVARAEIQDGGVIVYSPEVSQPVAVRYNWATNRIGNLYNPEGLPAQNQVDGEEFTRLLLLNHKRILGLILSLVPRGSDADDVMQETCSILWAKFNQFEPGTDFGAWALRVARFQVMSYYNRRRRAQARLSDETIETIADSLAEPRWETSARSEALAECLGKLKQREVDLVHRRYTAEDKIEEIAAALGSTTHAVYKSLARLQVRLLECVQSKVKIEEAL